MNVVNTNFTIAGLQYLGNGTHTTDFAGTSHLQVNGPVYVGYGGSADGATVIWTNGGTVQIGDPLNLKTFYIGANTSSSTVSNTGSLLLDGPTVDALVSAMTIGGKMSTDGYGTANGRLVLGSNSSLHVGTVAAPGVVNIGMNQSTHYSGGVHSGGDGTGLLDATQGDIELHLSELNVGRHRGYYGSTTGTFTTGDRSVVTMTTGNIGTTSGGTATGTVNLQGGRFSAKSLSE